MLQMSFDELIFALTKPKVSGFFTTSLIFGSTGKTQMCMVVDRGEYADYIYIRGGGVFESNVNPG